MSDMQRLSIERLGHRGEGLAEGIFIPRVLPGELVEGVVTDGRMAQPRILTPAPERVAPGCRHYRGCGGCALQHARDDFVAEWKQQVVTRALAAQGLDAPFRQLHTSPAGSRRRATLAGRRLKSGALVGFHARGSDSLTAVPDCRLLAPALIAALPACEALVMAGGARKGELALQMTALDTGVDLVVRGAKPLDDALRQNLPQIAARHRLARLSWEDEVLYQTEPPGLMFGRARVCPPPGGFLQATPQGEAALQHAMREAVAGARRLADLFAGCGTFTLPLAEDAEVHAVEGEAAALAALDAGWRATPGLKRVSTEARDLFRRPLLPDELARFDAIVIDPPRAGAEAQIRQIARARVPLVGAVSCNPVTFARDARLLTEAGYALEWVQVIDQFRWSAHVELAARFRLNHIG